MPTVFAADALFMACSDTPFKCKWDLSYYIMKVNKTVKWLKYNKFAYPSLTLQSFTGWEINLLEISLLVAVEVEEKTSVLFDWHLIMLVLSSKKPSEICLPSEIKKSNKHMILNKV